MLPGLLRLMSVVYMVGGVKQGQITIPHPRKCMSIRLRLLLIRRHPYPRSCPQEQCLPPRPHQQRRHPFVITHNGSVGTDLSRDHVTIVRWGTLGRVEFDIPDSGEATNAFMESISGKSELFRQNPGKEQRIFSDRHPYYGKRGIMHCSVKVDKLAANLDNNEECEVLRNLLQKERDKDNKKAGKIASKK